jgi:hypothetical protein
MDDKQIFDAMVELIKKRIPGFEIGYKDESFVSKLLGVLVWLFNRNYMKTYTTTRYPKVFFPSRQFVRNSYRGAWKILAHEYVHLWDRKQEGVWFNVRYASPQMWAVLSLAALITIWVGPWGLLGLIPLLCLLPLPSPGRRDIELRGYTMSMAVNHWRYGDVRDSTKDWMVKHFTGSGYYFMWPFKEDMRIKLYDAESKLDSAPIPPWRRMETFKEVRALLVEAGYAKSG